jgi:hypothetical protein
MEGAEQVKELNVLTAAERKKLSDLEGRGTEGTEQRRAGATKWKKVTRKK